MDTNAVRTVTADASGKFQITALPIGRYTATSGGKTAELEVLAGQGVEAQFIGAGVQAVTISGRRTRIDVSNATNGATFTARELAKLPIAKSVDAIVQLAPNTTRGDPTYVAGSSLGGGAASENAYYINGFSVTNPLSQLGGSELPFGAIAQAQILTGGYGAEFGRSVGGVINVTTKSGTNNWEVGAIASTAPSNLRSKYRDTYFSTNNVPLAAGAVPTDGTVRVRRADNKVSQTQVGAFVGGPIVKDKLFMFAAFEENDQDQHLVNGASNSTANASNGFIDRTIKTTRYLTKFDWNITDNHRLELTFIGDLPAVDTSFRSYTYARGANGSSAAAPGVVGSTVKSSQHEELNGTQAPNGGEDQILRYTGNFTDDLTFTALYGKSKAVHIYEPAGYNPTLFSVSAPSEARVTGFNYSNSQGFAGLLNKSGSTDSMKSFRADLEWKLGTHTLRGGIDNNKISGIGAGTALGGGGQWIYGFTGTPTVPTKVSGGSIPALTPYGGIAAQGYYVQKNLSSTVSDAYASQSAQYIEDRWQITKNLLITAGIRDEQFSNSNQDQVKFVEQKNQIAPRLSAAWDVNGDASLKVFGSAGRYMIQMPSVIALRVANGSLNTLENFVYTGTDANGLPTGLTSITPPQSANNEFGQAKDPKTLASTNLKPAYQDELTLGFEKAFSPDLNFGAKLTYRTLKSTIDDWGDDRPFTAYAKAHGIDTTNWAGFGGALINPGVDNDFLVDFEGKGVNYTKVHVTAADMGFEKAKRTYAAIDLFAEHPMRNGWYGRVNYTLGRSTGNTEGQTLSDTGTAQADVSITQTWDYKEIMYYANGLLPNDRKHQIKAYGFYELNPQWTVGANLIIASGRPRSCLGTSPLPDDPYTYNSGEHFCFGSNATLNVPSPRGTLGRLPWDRQLDLNLVYKPAFMADLSLKLDVFNVFNTQSVTKVVEQYNSRNARSATYEAQLGFTAPRSARLTAEFNHKF
ncbi:MAG TPA: TonB-dependent receptor [Telluria sp.]|nr:TonB-dependent receptor [Telluria sp.]